MTDLYFVPGEGWFYDEPEPTVFWYDPSGIASMPDSVYEAINAALVKAIDKAVDDLSELMAREQAELDYLATLAEEPEPVLMNLDFDEEPHYFYGFDGTGTDEVLLAVYERDGFFRAVKLA